MTPRERHRDLLYTMGCTAAVRQLASLLALSRTGADVFQEDLDQANDDAGAVAREYGASPDELTAALYLHEPQLAEEF